MKKSQNGDKTARIEYLHVQNFRALRDVEFKDLTPLPSRTSWREKPISRSRACRSLCQRATSC
jgi:hypothetical protein